MNILMQEKKKNVVFSCMEKIENVVRKMLYGSPSKAANASQVIT
jgi:hypothetical protein